MIPGGGPATPVPVRDDPARYYFVDNREPPRAEPPIEQPAPANPTHLLGYDVDNHWTRMKLNRVAHLAANGGWAASL